MPELYAIKKHVKENIEIFVDRIHGWPGVFFGLLYNGFWLLLSLGVIATGIAAAIALFPKTKGPTPPIAQPRPTPAVISMSITPRLSCQDVSKSFIDNVQEWYLH